jgi:hypothetical protein
MPIPVPPFAADTFPAAKTLNLALYTADGTLDNPTGVAFLAYRPLFFETYGSATTWHSAPGGSQTSMSAAASSVSSSLVVLDTAGYYGLTSDLPGLGYYQYTPAIQGSAGDGVTPGGWMVVSSFVPVVHTSTQTSVSADLYEVGVAATSGSRQQPNTTNDSCPFYLDLVNVGTNTWAPALTLYDSGSATAANAVSADASGETPRFAAMWAAASSTTSGQISYTANGTYSWTAPAGVTSVTVTGLGAGAGGGAGNVSGGGAEFGGGGGGGGEFASGTVAVTSGNVYAPTVGAGGPGGAEPGGGGTAGGTTQFAGDVANVTANGGSSGGGATTGGNGAGGAGGTGSSASTHHNGGAGATGSSASYGGGGGSSAGKTAAGNSATSAAGASPPSGGGPGGSGGTETLTVVQHSIYENNGVASLSFSFPHAVQAGNTVIVAAMHSESNGGSISGITLNDGTVLNSAENASVPSAQGAQVYVFAAYNVAGGENSATVSGEYGTNLTTIAAFWEVSGLGAAPSTDLSTSNSGNSTGYTVSGTTAGAPEIWIGAVAGHGTGSFSLNNPGGGWTTNSDSNSDGGQNSAMIAGYKIATSAGTASFAGSISSKQPWAALIVTFQAAASTPGNAPPIGPGGGGGAGLGAFNGGAGLDGSLTLTWTGVSGGGYGTPAEPTPYASWTSSTRVGTSGDANADVDLNSSSGITGVVNFLSNAPVFRIAGTSAQSIASSTLTAVAFTGATATADSYSGYSSGTYTVQRAGLYLFGGLVAFASASGGTRQAGVTVNGTTYWGPGNLPTAAGTCNVTKTQVFSLQAGDTVQLACRQDKGSPVALATTDATRMFLTWLNEVGTPPVLWTPPDATYRWVSGTPVGALPALFQQHLANDLGFLCQGPYLMAYQTAAQSGLTASAFATVTMDTVAGIAHADTGDNYSGWTGGASNKYTAQQPGWYLYCAEYFLGSSAASGATAVAGVLPSTSGGVSPLHTPDSYQRLTATTTASVGSGCTAFGLYYLLAGETLTPQAEGLSYSGTFATLTGTSNGGVYASHCEIIWVSN